MKVSLGGRALLKNSPPNDIEAPKTGPILAGMAGKTSGPNFGPVAIGFLIPKTLLLARRFAPRYRIVQMAKKALARTNADVPAPAAPAAPAADVPAHTRWVGSDDLRDKYGIPYTIQQLRKLWVVGKFPKPFRPFGRKLVWRADAIEEWQAKKEKELV